MNIWRNNFVAAMAVLALPVAALAAVQLSQSSGFLAGIGRTETHQFPVKATEYSVNISAPDTAGFRTVKVSVPIDKIDTDNRVRNWHMRTSVFGEGLDQGIDTVDFVAKSDRPVGPGTLELPGQLSINGMTKPATLSLEITGDETLVGKGQATVDLDDYGIAKPGMGPMKVQSKVTMKFEISVPRAEIDKGLPVALNIKQ